MAATTMTVRLEDYEKEAFSRFAKANGISLSEYARRCMAEDFEDAMDARLADEAYREYLSNPVTCSAEELDRMLG